MLDKSKIKRLIPSNIKQIIKGIPLPLTKNHKYDLYTKKLIKENLRPKSNCIDVGCYKGEILDLYLKYCKNGRHIAFEPVKSNYAGLVKKYSDKSNVELHNFALSNRSGTEQFHHVKSNPSYSGFKQRQYEGQETIDIIHVNTITLDELSLPDKIDFIKIDVEGAESLVLKGAFNTIRKNKPIIVFEHGFGGSELYGTSSELYKLLTKLELRIFTFESFFKNQAALSEGDFQNQFDKRLNHYFVAKVKN